MGVMVSVDVVSHWITVENSEICSDQQDSCFDAI